MKKEIMTVLTPDFYNDFHCVAADCRHNCCVYPWVITINKKNYKLLHNLREPKWLTENLNSYVKRNDCSTSDNDYAVIVYNEQGCSFQTGEGLCRLQAELGDAYLSNTCKLYPRLNNLMASPGFFNLHIERSLTLSCEEVVRILLHKPEPIQFDVTRQQYIPAAFAGKSKHINNSIAVGKRPILEHYSLIHAICIAVLQNRDYTIEQRMILLAVYLDKLSQAEQSETTDTIPAMTDIFVAAVDERLYDGLFATAKIPTVTVLLTNFAVAYTFAAHADTHIVERCSNGIETVDYSTRTANYREFTGDKEYFLEHLLVTELFGKALPFKSDRSIEDCLQYLVSIFAIFRFMLGGYLGVSHTLTEVEFIDFVAYFGKTVLHSTNSFDNNIKLLNINEMNTLAHMVAIIIG